MKTQDIKRGITSRHSQAGRAGPDLGRVVRLRGAELQTGERRSRRRGERRSADRSSPARKKAVLIWSIMIGGAAAAVIGVVISLWLSPYLFPEPVETTGIHVKHETKVRVESKFPSPTREQALDMVKRAISNRDPEQVESLFRLGASSRPEVVGFFNGLEERDGPVDHYDWLSSMDVDGLLMEGMLVVSKGKDQGKPVERLAFLTPDPAGNWKVDFDAYARTVKPSWSELLEKGADHALVRVFVARDVYYNGPFSDDKEWVCYGIASPDTEQLLRGYCRMGSPQEAAMEKLLSDGVKMSRATLEIQRVKEGEPRQFEITRLRAPDWVLPATPEG